MSEAIRATLNAILDEDQVDLTEKEKDVIVHSIQTPDKERYQELAQEVLRCYRCLFTVTQGYTGARSAQGEGSGPRGGGVATAGGVSAGASARLGAPLLCVFETDQTLRNREAALEVLAHRVGPELGPDHVQLGVLDGNVLPERPDLGVVRFLERAERVDVVGQIGLELVHLRAYRGGRVALRHS